MDVVIYELFLNVEVKNKSIVMQKIAKYTVIISRKVIMCLARQCRVMCPSGSFWCRILDLPTQHRQQTWLVYTFHKIEIRLGVNAFNRGEADFRARRMCYPHSDLGTQEIHEIQLMIVAFSIASAAA
jgi:hypothetical protein